MREMRERKLVAKDQHIIDEEIPTHRTGLEWIGEKSDTHRALALIREGVPLDRGTQLKIFDRTFSPEETPTMDYVDLATDEIVEDLLEISNTLPKYEYKEGLYKSFLNRLRKAFTGKFDDQKENYLKKLENSIHSHRVRGHASSFLFRSRLKQDMTRELESVFQNPQMAEYIQFMNTVRSNPQKPFLIIDAHGGADDNPDGTQKWVVGEESTDNFTNLNNLFERMKTDSDKYSAILLVSCNEANLKPKKQGNTPIFYVDGLAGNDPGKIARIG